MKKVRTRKQAIIHTLKAIRHIYEEVREGKFSPYYGRKLANHYWEKLNLQEREIARYFGNSSDSMELYKVHKSSLDWLLGRRKGECLYALRYFGLIGTLANRSKKKEVKRA